MIRECPWCGVALWIEEINCGIFRCGIIKASGVQLSPHLPELECEAAIPYIWGCSRPFMLSGLEVVKCGYI